MEAGPVLQAAREGVHNMWPQGRYYAFGVFKGEETPYPATAREKFNPLQKFSYIAVQFILTPIMSGQRRALVRSRTLPPRRPKLSGAFRVLDSIPRRRSLSLHVVHVYMAALHAHQRDDHGPRGRTSTNLPPRMATIYTSCIILRFMIANKDDAVSKWSVYGRSMRLSVLYLSSAFCFLRRAPGSKPSA